MVKFLLVFFVLSLLLRFVLPALLRWLLVGFVKKQTHRYGRPGSPNPYGAPTEATPDAAPGEVRVEYVPPRKSPKQAEKFKDGEYVDFEEVQ